MKPIAVITTHRFFKDFFLRDIHPEDRRHFICANRQETVMGLEFSAVIRVGPYTLVPEAEELWYWLQARV